MHNFRVAWLRAADRFVCDDFHQRMQGCQVRDGEHDLSVPAQSRLADTLLLQVPSQHNCILNCKAQALTYDMSNIPCHLEGDSAQGCGRSADMSGWHVLCRTASSNESLPAEQMLARHRYTACLDTICCNVHPVCKCQQQLRMQTCKWQRPGCTWATLPTAFFWQALTIRDCSMRCIAKQSNAAFAPCFILSLL